MARKTDVVCMSSKGQVVIPADLRRRLGWKTGQPLAVRAGESGEIILRLVDHVTAGGPFFDVGRWSSRT